MHWKMNIIIYMIWSKLARQYETKVFHSTVVHLKLNLVVVIYENYVIEPIASFKNYSSFNTGLKLNYGRFKREGKNMNSTAPRDMYDVKESDLCFLWWCKNFPLYRGL